MSSFVIPIIVLLIIGISFFNKRNIYEDFLNGAKEGMIIIYNIIPSIVAMTFAINIFVKSGVINLLLTFIKPIINIESELILMSILRPISGTSTLVLLQNIFSVYGADSFVGRLASTIQGCTDTTIYVLALYFSSVKISKTRYALFVGLFADLVGIIASFVVVSIFFN